MAEYRQKGKKSGKLLTFDQAFAKSGIKLEQSKNYYVDADGSILTENEVKQLKA